MPFTEEEKRRWYEEKKMREQGTSPDSPPIPLAVCLHCQRPFGINEGVITAVIALCDICNGD